MSAMVAVDAILADLRDRRGLRQAWETLDDEIQDEIIETWREIVSAEIAKAVEKARASK